MKKLLILFFCVSLSAQRFPSFWTNSNGSIQGTSTVVDGTNAVAFSLNSSNALSTSGARLMALANMGTNVSQLSPYGGLHLGPLNFAGSILNSQAAGFSIAGATDLGTLNSQIDVKFADSSAAPTDNTVDFFADNEHESAVFYHKVSHTFPVFGALGSSVEWQIGTNNADFWLSVVRSDGSTAVAIVELWPSVGDGGVAHNFDTPDPHTVGVISTFKNNGALVIATGATNNNLILYGTTNQVVFGSTNNAPVSAVSPTKWISVQVQGESAVYRIPLYE